MVLALKNSNKKENKRKFILKKSKLTEIYMLKIEAGR